MDRIREVESFLTTDIGTRGDGIPWRDIVVTLELLILGDTASLRLGSDPGLDVSLDWIDRQF